MLSAMGSKEARQGLGVAMQLTKALGQAEPATIRPPRRSPNSQYRA